MTEPETAAAIIPAITRELDGPINPIRWSCIVEPMLWLIDRAPIDHATRKRLGRSERPAQPRATAWLPPIPRCWPAIQRAAHAARDLARDEAGRRWVPSALRDA
ncbi:MAG TPA: hypothetical protein VLW53_04620 [Candidatus Eisenbacteria bacterium]|nr:hypothetical protein [Candidatus Eisenbacteria bacterium]